MKTMTAECFALVFVFEFGFFERENVGHILTKMCCVIISP